MSHAEITTDDHLLRQPDGMSRAPTPARSTFAWIVMRYRVPEPVLHTRLENDCVLLDLESGRYFSVNSVGSRIWSQLVEQPRTMEELLHDITQEYHISRETAEQDVLELVQDLVKHKLLETID